MKMIHLTDTHFVPKGKTLYGGDPRANLERCIQDINTNHADADLCVVTGDLTHWGEAKAFASLKECLDELKPPLQLLVGNHDARSAFSKCFPDQPVDENGFIQSSRDYPAGRFLFLDSNKSGQAAGVYCDTRQAWLERELKEAGDRPIYLFMHHPPFHIGLPYLDRIALVQREEFADVIRPYASQIRHLFFGHIHRPLSGNWLGISFSTLRSMNHQVWLDFNAKKDIPASFEPPAYAVVLFYPDRLVIHPHDFMDASQKFSLSKSPVNDWAKRSWWSR